MGEMFLYPINLVSVINKTCVKFKASPADFEGH